MEQIYAIKAPETWNSIVERLVGKPALSIVFQVTENCNMACTYCYQNCKTIHSMDWNTAKIVIDNIFNLDQDKWGTIILEFIGGEPLLEIELIEQITKYTLDTMLNHHSPWLEYFRVSIGSNGLAYYNTKVQNYFQKYKHFVDFTVSIDGNKELHDSCRVDLSNNPTYDKVISAVNHYREHYNYIDNTKMTISPNNVFYLKDALINLINEKYKYIHCNCIFEKGWEINHAKILYSELKKLANYIIENELNTKVFIRLFEEDNFCPMDENDNQNWCGGIFKADEDRCYYSIKYNGQIFPCIRYMNSSLNGKQPELPIGSIYQEQNKLYQKNIEFLSNITRRSQSTDECFYCPIAKGCSWCSAHNYEEFGTPNKRTTYICCMHKATSLANVYYWNMLYRHLNINKRFKMHLPKEEVLKIIDENEYNYLLNLSN